MSLEALRQVLKAADASPAALFGTDEARAWPERSLETLAALGLLREDAPARAIICPGCDMQCLGEVELIGEGDATRAMIYCDQREDMEPIEVPLECLRRWSVDVGGLAKSLTLLLDGSRPTEEVVSTRLWWLGQVAVGETRADVFLASGTRRNDATRIFGQPQAFRGSYLPIVLTLSDASTEEAFVEGAEVVPLSRVLNIKDSKLRVAKREITDAIRRAQRRLRESRRGPAAASIVVLSIKQESLRAKLRGEELSLSVRLFGLLVFLAQRALEDAGGWVSKNDIHDVLWPPSSGGTRTYLPQIRDIIRELRNAFDAVEPGSGKRLVLAKREGGYQLRLNPLEIALS